jgi:hypothetical protein
VGDNVYAARIEYDKVSEIVDTRVTAKSICRFDLRANIVSQVLLLMRRFGLVYGAIDMGFSEVNGFTFFEINPEGQYLWTKIEGGLPISHAIAALLTKERHT